MADAKRLDESTTLFERFGRGPAWALLSAVFLIFAPLWPIVQPAPEKGGFIEGRILLFVLSGVIAVVWWLAFVWKKWMFLIAAPAGPVCGMLVGRLPEPFRFHPVKTAWEDVVVVGLIVAGYTLFVRFIACEAARTLRFETEVGLAAGIHRTMVPRVEGVMGGVEVYGASIASTEVGGDLVDVIEGPSGVDAYIADVTGHGVRAGMVMTMVKSAMHARSLSTEELGGCVEGLNTVFARLTPGDMFVTGAFLRVRGGGAIDVVVAGHPAIIVVRAGGAIERLESDGPPLGVAPGEAFPAKTARVEPGDLFVLYTDGLVEAMDRSGAMFGEERLVRSIASRRGEALAAIFEGVIADVQAFGTPKDDQSMLLVRATTRP